MSRRKNSADLLDILVRMEEESARRGEKSSPLLSPDHSKRRPAQAADGGADVPGFLKVLSPERSPETPPPIDDLDDDPRENETSPGPEPAGTSRAEDLRVRPLGPTERLSTPPATASSPRPLSPPAGEEAPVREPAAPELVTRGPVDERVGAPTSPPALTRRFNFERGVFENVIDSPRTPPEPREPMSEETAVERPRRASRRDDVERAGATSPAAGEPPWTAFSREEECSIDGYGEIRYGETGHDDARPEFEVIPPYAYDAIRAGGIHFLVHVHEPAGERHGVQATVFDKAKIPGSESAAGDDFPDPSDDSPDGAGGNDPDGGTRRPVREKPGRHGTAGRAPRGARVDGPHPHLRRPDAAASDRAISAGSSNVRNDRSGSDGPGGDGSGGDGRAIRQRERRRDAAESGAGSRAEERRDERGSQRPPGRREAHRLTTVRTYERSTAGTGSRRASAAGDHSEPREPRDASGGSTDDAGADGGPESVPTRALVRAFESVCGDEVVHTLRRPIEIRVGTLVVAGLVVLVAAVIVALSLQREFSPDRPAAEEAISALAPYTSGLPELSELDLPDIIPPDPQPISAIRNVRLGPGGATPSVDRPPASLSPTSPPQPSPAKEPRAKPVRPPAVGAPAGYYFYVQSGISKNDRHYRPLLDYLASFGYEDNVVIYPVGDGDGGYRLDEQGEPLQYLIIGPFDTKSAADHEIERLQRKIAAKSYRSFRAERNLGGDLGSLHSFYAKEFSAKVLRSATHPRRERGGEE